MSTITPEINITPNLHSRLNELDMDNIPFGKFFSDHMLVADYVDGRWTQAEIVPYGKLALAPSVSALNYGQSIFEGMKAMKSPLGEPLLFRPEENYVRMLRSGIRMCMPEIPHDLFMNGLSMLVNRDSEWIPPADKGSLYIRPLYFATDEYVGIKASSTYKFVIFTCPVGAYYKEPVNLLVTKEFVRAVVGGTGNAKAAGNYASSLYPDKLAKEKNYHNVLWLDAREHQYIEECGTMNVFFVIDGVVITPSLTGTILAGITRDSVIRLLKDEGYRVEQRRVSIYELQEAYDQGLFTEAFGTGTAATIAHVAKIGFAGRDMVLPPSEDRPIGNWLSDKLFRVKSGQDADPHNWVQKI